MTSTNLDPHTEQLERRVVMPLGEWYPELVHFLKDDYFAAKDAINKALFNPNVEEGQVEMSLAVVEAMSTTRTLNSSTHPALFEQVVLQMLDSIQNPTEANLKIAEMMEKLHSVSYTGLAARFSSNVVIGQSVLQLLEPAFMVYTQETKGAEPTIAFQFTVSPRTGFEFNLMNSIPSIEAAKRVKSRVAPLIEELFPTTTAQGKLPVKLSTKTNKKTSTPKSSKQQKRNVSA